MDDPKKSVPDDAPGVEVPPAIERDNRGDDEHRKDELDRLAEELTPGGDSPSHG
jgi:hypothetical protein